MKSSTIVAIIDAAKRNTGQADPDIVFYNDDMRNVIYLDRPDNPAYEPIDKNIGFYTNRLGRVQIPLSELKC